MRFWKLFTRSIRLRCPCCGRGKLFSGLLRMNSNCSHCGIKFEREPGFFLGSIYFNYGLTALLMTVSYATLLFNRLAPEWLLLSGSLVFVIAFPLFFFRYARALWLGFDQWRDPRGVETEMSQS